MHSDKTDFQKSVNNMGKAETTLLLEIVVRTRNLEIKTISVHT